MQIVEVGNFEYIFEKLEQSFISPFSVGMTVSLISIKRIIEKHTKTCKN